MPSFRVAPERTKSFLEFFVLQRDEVQQEQELDLELTLSQQEVLMTIFVVLYFPPGLCV